MSLAFLQGVLDNHLHAGDALDKWLEDALTTDAGTRLAICVAIDLQLKQITPAIIRDIVVSFATANDDVVAHFASAVDKASTTLSLRSIRTSTAPPLKDDSYARTLKIASFVTRYLPDRGVTLDYADLEEIKRKYFPDDLLSIGPGGSMKDVTDYWTGRYDLVWVTPFSELVHTAAGDPGCVACAVNDALGLSFTAGVDGAPHLVCVRYPKTFLVDCARPNAFHADWTAEGYFLSAGLPTDWGLTHSCAGSSVCQRERVHNGFAGLSDGFRGYNVGEVKPLVADVSRLIEDGLDRLQNVI